MKGSLRKRLAVMTALLLAVFTMFAPLPRSPFVQEARAQSFTKNTVRVFVSGVRGTTTSSTYDIGDADALVAFLDVTAQAGSSPTLDVAVQDSPTGAAPWFALGSFTQVTASTSNQVVVASRAPARYVRFVGTVGGGSTPTFTYSLAFQSYKGPAVSVTTTTAGAATFTQITVSGNNGAQTVYGVNTELLTLSTGGATTDTTGNLLPAGAVIDAVQAIVTVAITTATAFGLGDPTTATRFTAAGAAAAALGTRISGIDHWNGNITTTAAGPTQASAAKVRVTANGTPGAGQVRITVFYRLFTAPTS
jgi:hypothetical protein